MKISIIGYGKMGKQIEALALERCHTIHSVIAKESWLSNDIEGADVAIEFSRPEAALVNIRKCFQANVPVVIGTTGWYDNYDDLKAECLKNNNAISLLSALQGLKSIESRLSNIIKDFFSFFITPAK